RDSYQSGPGRLSGSQGGVPAGLQRQKQSPRISRRGSVGADLHGRQGGVWHRHMKFAMNGVLTIGTLDGANVEIRDAVGPENFFLFGLTAAQVERLKTGGYAPREF